MYCGNNGGGGVNCWSQPGCSWGGAACYTGEVPAAAWVSRQVAAPPPSPTSHLADHAACDDPASSGVGGKRPAKSAQRPQAGCMLACSARLRLHARGAACKRPPNKRSPSQQEPERPSWPCSPAAQVGGVEHSIQRLAAHVLLCGVAVGGGRARGKGGGLKYEARRAATRCTLYGCRHKVLPGRPSQGAAFPHAAAAVLHPLPTPPPARVVSARPTPAASL